MPRGNTILWCGILGYYCTGGDEDDDIVTAGMWWHRWGEYACVLVLLCSSILRLSYSSTRVFLFSCLLGFFALVPLSIASNCGRNNICIQTTAQMTWKISCRENPKECMVRKANEWNTWHFKIISTHRLPFDDKWGALHRKSKRWWSVRTTRTGWHTLLYYSNNLPEASI